MKGRKGRGGEGKGKRGKGMRGKGKGKEMMKERKKANW